MVFANSADLVDVAQRLLARSRALVRNQRLLVDALEEMLLWFPVPPDAAAHNGPTIDVNVWRSVARNAAVGDHGVGLATASSSEAVLLQPGLPGNLHELQRALPGVSPRVVAGLRRRLWQRHVATLYEELGR